MDKEKENDWLTLLRQRLNVGDDASVEQLMTLLKNIDRANQIIDAKSKITDWESFAEMLDKAFPFDAALDHEVWQYENFVPDEKHDVGGGAWIKVPTEIGFNVYYAKQTKKQFNRTLIERKIQRLEKEADNVSLKALKSIVATKGKVDLIQKEVELRKEIIDLTIELKHAVMFEVIEMTPYCVKYQVSKTKWVTLYPYQYEIAADIDIYVQRIIEAGKTEAVTYKSLFSSRDSDAVFYLQSRGISKEVAIMMTKLRDCYFIVNAMEIFKSYYGRMVIVEKK